MRKKMSILLLLAALAGVLLTGCAARGGVATDGSTSMSKVIGALAEAYENETGVVVTYNATGSGTGIQAVSEGRCDIGLSSRALKDEETARGLTATVLAYDGIAVVVNGANPVNDLSLDTVARIFTGEITDWSEVGGNEGPIVLIGREAGSGTRDGFETVTDTAEKCSYRQELTSTGDVITAVAGNPNAIGYASVASVKDTVKVVTVNGVAPTEETMKNGDYAIQRPFVLVTKNALSDEAQAFFDYITGGEADDIIRAAGAVPVH